MLEEVNMYFAKRLLPSIAAILATMWLIFAGLSVIDLVRHWLNSTSDMGSQLTRSFTVVIFLVAAASVFFRFTGWRWIVSVPCLLIAVRDYFFLMVPLELHWGPQQIVAAARLAVVVATILLAILWTRFHASRTENRAAA